MKHILLGLIGVIFLFGCNNPCPDCGCDNVDDCLSKYKFEEARKYAASYPEGGWLHGEKFEYGKSEAMYKIIISEIQYWLSQNNLDKAQIGLNELNNLTSDENVEKSYAEFSNLIILKYCENKMWGEAESVARQLPEKIVFDKGAFFTKSDYKEYEKELKNDQGLEYSKSTGGYNIVTYSYPRKDALKIIEEFQLKKE